jgi:hypothetical protein
MKTTKWFLVFTAFAALLLTSCDGNLDDSTRKQAAKDDLQVDGYYDDMVAESDDVQTMILEDKSGLENGSKDGSKTYTIVNNPNGSRDIIVTFINYSNPNFQNSRVKNGIVNIHVTGGPDSSTFVRVITFTNFTINNNQITGTITITKVSDYVTTIRLANCMVTFTDGTTYTRSGNKTRTLTDGYTTSSIWDNVYSITGSFTGTNRAGNDYTHTTDIALVKVMAYRYFVSGIIHIEVGNRDIVIDFGDGTLDNLVDITINGTTYPDIELTH